MLVLDNQVCDNPVRRMTDAENDHTVSGRTTDADFLMPVLSDRLLLLRG